MLFRDYILLFFQKHFYVIGRKIVCNDAKCIENHQQTRKSHDIFEFLRTVTSKVQALHVKRVARKTIFVN